MRYIFRQCQQLCAHNQWRNRRLIDRKAPIFVLFLSLSILAPVRGEVTVLLATGAAVENEFLQNIILESAALSLEHSNLHVTYLPEGTDAPIVGAQIVPEGIGPLATERQADFALISRYELSDDTIRLDFAWYDTELGTITSREASSGKIGLTLDRIIDRTVTKVLNSVGDRIREVAARKPEEPTPVTETGNAGEEGGDTATAAAATAAPAGTTAPSVEAQGSGSAATGSDTPPALARQFLDFSAGFATFIAVGDSSDYITLGYNPTFDISFRINLPSSSHIGIGISSGINTFEAQGLALSLKSLIVPVGLDLRYVLGTDSAIGLSLRLSGGPAFLILQPPGDLLTVLSWDLKMKVIPYASTGLGLRIKFTRFMGFAFDMGYSLYLEDYDSLFFIMGFTPAATLYFSL
jgi:hypothetical protein